MDRISRIKKKFLSRHGGEACSSEQSISVSTSSIEQHTGLSTRPPNDLQFDERTEASISGVSTMTENLQLTPKHPTDGQDAPASLPEKLWKAAYDALKQEEPDVVKAYEKILLKVQEEWDNEIVPPELEKPEHVKSPGSCNMWRLIHTGLKRSKRQAEWKESVSSVIGIVDSIKGVVDKAVKYSPEAGIVWAGASLGLEILANPMKEPGLNRKGITHVLSRMEWYWNLADLVLNEKTPKDSIPTLRTTLECHVIEFYKKLLLFQMQSARLYYRNWASTILRDTIKLDDWAEKLVEVIKAENQIRQDIELYNDQEIKSSLQEMEKNAASQELILTRIYKLMREEARLKEKSKQNEEDKKCLKDLFITDPQDDREAMQEQKGSPNLDSYGWILRNPKYQEFIDDPEKRVLWINGLPGKGKTMLVFGLLDELSKTARPLPFFLCQANGNQEDRSSFNAVIRGLIYMLVEYQPSLMAIIRPYYDKLEGKLFSDRNSIKLKGILKQMLSDPSLHGTILAIDAVDECKIGRSQLTNLIVQLSKTSHAKWIISSRDWPEISQEFSNAQGLLSLNLSDEDDEIAEAVNSFIVTRVDELATRWGDNTNLREEVFKYMQSHADNTFLWISLVCERLSQSHVGPRRVMAELRKFPQSLKSLYRLMLDRIIESDEADLLKEILAVVCVTYRPLGAEEIASLILSMETYDEDAVKDVVGYCGSFITYQRKSIYFVHQSAKDFLLDDGRVEIFAHGISHQHSKIFLRSVDCMESILRRDIYDLQSPGTLVDDVSPPDPDPLISIKYACLYWAKHLLECSPHKVPERQYLEKTYDFLQKGLLYWLESLSLLREMAVAVRTILEIESTLKIEAISGFKAFIGDARRFIYNFKLVIQKAPLQVYVSALIFSPQQSHIRDRFRDHAPKWIKTMPKMPHDWEAYDQSLYIASAVYSVEFSPDGKLFAVHCNRSSEIYETVSGDVVFEVENSVSLIRETLSEHYRLRVVFSPNGDFIAIWIDKGVVGIFRTGTFDLLQKLEYSCHQVLFMPDSESLLLVVEEDIIVLNWKTQEQLAYQSGVVNANTQMEMLPGGNIIAISPKRYTVDIWDMATWTCKQKLYVDTKRCWPQRLTCSAQGNRIAVAANDCVNVWDLTETGIWIQNRELVIHHRVTALAFSADGQSIIAGLPDHSIWVFDSTGTGIKNVIGHPSTINGLTFCHINNQIASCSSDGTVRLWNFSNIDGQNTMDCDSTLIETSRSDGVVVGNRYNAIMVEMLFSPRGKMLMTFLHEKESKIWYTDTRWGAPPLVSFMPLYNKQQIKFTSDDQFMILQRRPGDLEVWDTMLGEMIDSFSIQNLKHVHLSPDGKHMAFLIQEYSDRNFTNSVGFHNLTQNTSSMEQITYETISTGDSYKAVISDNFKHIALEDIDTCSVKIISHKSSKWHEHHFHGCIYNRRITFSPDDKWLLAYKVSGTFQILETSTPHRFLELQFPGPEESLSHIRNNIDISCKIATEFGTIGLGKPEAPDHATRIGWGVSFNKEWIMRDNERMIWVPPEYRKLALDTHGSRIAFACDSGRLTMMELEQEN